MHIRLLTILLAALLTLGEGTLQMLARTPEPAKGPEEVIAYIGQTGAELRQTLNGGEGPWIFHKEDAGGYAFRLEGVDCLFSFSGEELDYGRSPDEARCVKVELPLPDGEITPLEERLEVLFAYEEYEDGSGGPGCFFAADMEKRLMYYVELWDDGGEGQFWLTILYMNDENYRALTEIGKEKAKG